MKPSLFLLKNTPEDLWAVSTKNPTAREQLRLLREDFAEGLPTFRVLIAYTDQLHHFVQGVPPLAWELLEHAQEPLEIVYPERKLTVSDDEDAPKICVRWIKQPKLATFLRKEGPMWSTQAPALPGRLSPFTTVDCYHKGYPYHRVRTIATRADGTFLFLR